MVFSCVNGNKPTNVRYSTIPRGKRLTDSYVNGLLSGITKSVKTTDARYRKGLKTLEPYEGKLSCTVPRRRKAGNRFLLSDSRMIIAGREYVHCNTENSIEVIDELVREYWDICPLRELILDHGSEFGAHKINEDGSWNSEFKRHVEALGIKLILAAVRHPQTNGKVEKWSHTYKRFRGEFETFDEFVKWYNRRPHGALELEELESPEDAFWKRLPIEAKFRIGVRLFGL